MLVYYWFCIIFTFAGVKASNGNINGKNDPIGYQMKLEKEMANIYRKASDKKWKRLGEMEAKQRNDICKNVFHKNIPEQNDTTYKSELISNKYVLKYQHIDHPDTKMDILKCIIIPPDHNINNITKPNHPTIFFLARGNRNYVYKLMPAQESSFLGENGDLKSLPAGMKVEDLSHTIVFPIIEDSLRVSSKVKIHQGIAAKLWYHMSHKL